MAWRRNRLSLAAALALALGGWTAGCAAPADDDSADDDAGDDDTAGPMEPLLSYAVIADTHVTSEGDHADRLRAAVAWIAEQAAPRDLAFVLVLGDIAWGDGLDLILELFEPLPIPWIPINGDNELHGDEQPFHETFAPQYERLAGEIDGFLLAPTPVVDPTTGADSYLHNVSFQVRGVTFLGLDFAIRGDDTIVGETGDLHDHDGGTWPFLLDELARRSPEARGSVVLFSHIPMHIGLFDQAEMEVVEGDLAPYAGQLSLDLAGHVHLDYSEPVGDDLYTVQAVDAVWDDEVRVWVDRVEGNGAACTHALEPIDVPYP